MASKPQLPPQPRRPPAHSSVSLVHHPTSSKSQFHPSRQLHKPSELLDPTGKRKRTSEDSGESSDAGKWFENRNNHVGNRGSQLQHTDSPFFFRNSSGEESPEGGDGAICQGQAPLGQLLSPSLLSNNDSSNDFRSVIDDLTVQNKKLKKRLKKFERLHDTHLQDEKLFELRVHGLSAAKKRELESLLRKFSSSIEDQPAELASSSRKFVHNQSSNTSSGQTRNRSHTQFDPYISSSHTSTRQGDSAYVSMGSNPTPSNAPLSLRNIDQKPTSTTGQRNQMVQSYLHDQSSNLLFNHTAGLSDKAKRKLVVERLEQLFSGKGAATGGHQQPMQQQEVAQSAANDDRMEIERTGQPVHAEGLRQARIMPKAAEGKLILGSDAEKQDQSEDFNSLQVLGLCTDQKTDSRSPDQRPTRPLDLDPYRAQVPHENMDYIRHLGFSPPDLDNKLLGTQDDRHGWIYLNLLMNMAQLHTINVTAAFVKDAISKHSTKFELSANGRKIRWIGETNSATVRSDCSSGGGGESTSHEIDGDDHHLKHVQSFGRNASEPSAGQCHPSNSGSYPSGKPKDTFAYTPLFLHRESSEEDDYTSSGFGPSGPSDENANGPPGSSNLNSSGQATAPARRRRDDGPIIFYNKAKFCTDLSGDASGIGTIPSNKISYIPLGSHPMGGEMLPANESSDGDSISPLRRNAVLESLSKMDIDGASSTPSSANINFPSLTSSPAKSRDDNAQESSKEPVEFEVSGLGNVHPDDNFEITVQCQKLRSNFDDHQFGGATHHGSSHHVMQQEKFRDVLVPSMVLNRARFDDDSIEASTQALASIDKTNTASQPPAKVRRRLTRAPAVREKIISASRRNLPASRLPPPSYYFGHSNTPSDADSDVDSDMETTGAVSHGTPLGITSTPFQTSSFNLQNGLPRIPSMRTGSSNMQDSAIASNQTAKEGIDQTDFASGVGVAGDSDSDKGSATSEESLDLLAAAREQDPDTIIKREREYDADLAERLAEEIPAGSSAATAGGGSGYASPYTGLGNAQVKKHDDNDSEDSDESDGSGS